MQPVRKTWMQLLLSFATILLFIPPLLSQKINESYQLHIRKTNAPIRVDGVMDEAAWKEAAVAQDFYSVLPMDTSFGKVKTEVRMTYDDQNLYLIAICHHLLPGPYYVESLRRDWAFGKNDNFLVFIDTYNDLTNGFAFGSNAVGAQWDGIMYEGSKVDLSWDNKWESVAKNYDDKYIIEMAIPFKSIRFKKDITQWGINFSRLDLKTTEKSAWAPVPRQFPTASLSHTGVLVWDEPPPAPKANISIIPYTLGSVTKNHEKNTAADYKGEIGADAKISLTSSLNLDLTVNPDFSQVEVDQQITNLDRFELFFPERRQFFLENGDLFANFGYSTIRPFFSRRIGLGVPIQFGARLSGKLDKNWRIGLMDMQTEKVESTGLPAQNFAVLALQRKVFARSNIGFLFVNKQSLNYTPDDIHPTYSQYNRNIGLEYNLASSDNLWTGKAILLKSFSPGVSGDDITHAANLQYASRKFTISWQHEYVGKNYNAEVGYVPRRNYIRLATKALYNFFPKGKLILSHGPEVGIAPIFKPDFHFTDNTALIGYNITFRNQNYLRAWAGSDFIKLLFPFDPTNYTKDTLATGTRHNWESWGVTFTSKPQSLFTYAFTTTQGGYFANGNRLNLTASLGYRFQPYVSILLNASYNKLDLPEPWNTNVFWLIGPRLDVTMTNKLYLTAFLQYNDQLNNINLNTRLQWRYAPASDLFIVYTDNYLPEPFNVKNRALVLKLTYWWNL
ncbi:MAG: DUF5916 domain-containing protein [Saprospiraceae bacterium]|nr:DUF5916 domain-containing protein [Saprospiraceae bacterium]